MKKEFLTVSDFARELNISIQAVYKRINKSDSDLKPFVKKDNGKTYIDKAALIAVYNFKEPVDESNSPAIDILKTEILEKNKQIENLLAQLENANKLLDQQQQLMLLDKQKILALEQQTERKSIFDIFKRKNKRNTERSESQSRGII